MGRNNEAVARNVLPVEKFFRLTKTFIEKVCASAGAEVGVKLRIFPGYSNVCMAHSAEASAQLMTILLVLLVPLWSGSKILKHSSHAMRISKYVMNSVTVSSRKVIEIFSV